MPLFSLPWPSLASIRARLPGWRSLSLPGAFIAGILLTLSLTPYLPNAPWQRNKRAIANASSLAGAGIQHSSEEVEGDDDHIASYDAPIHLEDHTRNANHSNQKSPQKSNPSHPRLHRSITHHPFPTPLLLLSSLSTPTTHLLAKAEFLSPLSSSPKDRVALSLINHAESLPADQGIRPHRGDVLYEGTVGSTGLSLASLAKARGYTAHIFLPADASPAKATLLRKLGAKVTVVPTAPIVDKGHYVNAARAAAEEHTRDSERGKREGKGWFCDQFENEANWRAHFESTGPEILAQCGGKKIDAFVAGAGTGGTVSGVARYLKEQLGDKNVKVVLADPEGSSLYNKVKNGVMYSGTEAEGTRRRFQVDSLVEGIGMNRMTRNLEVGLRYVDDAVKVTDQQARCMGRWLVEKEGLFLGGSSCVNVLAAARVARRIEGERKKQGRVGEPIKVVTILCDSGVRYLERFWDDKKQDEGQEMSLEDILGEK